MLDDIEDILWEVPLGSSETISFDVSQGGEPVDFSAHTVQFFDVNPLLDGKLHGELPTDMPGRLTVKLDAVQSLQIRKTYNFRVRLIPPSGEADAMGFPLLRVIPQ